MFLILFAVYTLNSKSNLGIRYYSRECGSRYMYSELYELVFVFNIQDGAIDEFIGTQLQDCENFRLDKIFTAQNMGQSGSTYVAIR